MSTESRLCVEVTGIAPLKLCDVRGGSTVGEAITEYEAFEMYKTYSRFEQYKDETDEMDAELYAAGLTYALHSRLDPYDPEIPDEDELRREMFEQYIAEGLSVDEAGELAYGLDPRVGWKLVDGDGR